MKDCTDEQFIKLFERIGTAATARELETSERSVRRRRARLEESLGIGLAPGNGKAGNGARLELEISDGCVIVGSDAHYWPGQISTAHRAFVRACKALNPAVVILNGDIFDGASISRHAPIGWERRPTVIEELGTAQARTREIVDASPEARHIWSLGNHDARFETRLASVAPEFAHVEGVHLKDHFPDWEPCWSVWLNDDVVVKHRFKGGTHATHNNTLYAGTTLVTGHLHSAKVTPFTDYRGTRYGVDTGCLAPANGDQFIHYTEDNPRNWRSGFGVFHFYKGRLCHPELVLVWDEDAGLVEFRGKVYKV